MKTTHKSLATKIEVVKYRMLDSLTDHDYKVLDRLSSKLVESNLLDQDTIDQVNNYWIQSGLFVQH